MRKFDLEKDCVKVNSPEGFTLVPYTAVSRGSKLDPLHNPREYLEKSVKKTTLLVLFLSDSSMPTGEGQPHLNNLLGVNDGVFKLCSEYIDCKEIYASILTIVKELDLEKYDCFVDSDSAEYLKEQGYLDLDIIEVEEFKNRILVTPKNNIEYHFSCKSGTPKYDSINDVPEFSKLFAFDVRLKDNGEDSVVYNLGNRDE